MKNIYLHSIIDLITNSSTEIFCHSENSLAACRKLVDEFLLSLNSELKCDDIFELSVEPEEYQIENYLEYYVEDDIRYDSKYKTNGKPDEEKIKVEVKRREQQLKDYFSGKGKKPSWFDSYHVPTSLVLKPKSSKYEKLAKLFSEFLYSPDYYEYSN